MKYFLAFLLCLGVSLGLGLTVRQERAGFSVACQGVRTIGQMTRAAEIVTEALVVDVSPARDNVYAVTLQILKIFKGKPKAGEQEVGPLVQLLFLKPKSKKKQEVRSVKEPKKYLEACIYEMGLKKGKKYNLFLATQPGKMSSKKGQMARFVMTSPPVLSSNKSSRKILAVTCPGTACARPSQPKVKSVEMMLVNNSNKLKLVCRVKSKDHETTQISWLKDGLPVEEVKGKIKMRKRRNKSVLTVNHLDLSDGGQYSCVALSTRGRGRDHKNIKVKIQKRLTPPTTTTTTTTTTAAPPAQPHTRKMVATPMRRILFPKLPTESSSCPISGYCLNNGECSFIPWLGEMSCNCAPGYQGARCERKTTSALYASSFGQSNTPCLFGMINPYHSCH